VCDSTFILRFSASLQIYHSSIRSTRSVPVSCQIAGWPGFEPCS